MTEDEDHVPDYYYELHLTVVGVPSEVRQHVERIEWSFSCIDGDPILGLGVKCYATKHLAHDVGISGAINELSSGHLALQGSGLDVIRRKVELVVYDSANVTFAVR